jgi:hypothetical protein
MNALRLKVGSALLEAGATQALEVREMWIRYRRSGVAGADNRDLQLLAVLDMLSSAAIRLGMALMPRRLADV